METLLLTREEQEQDQGQEHVFLPDVPKRLAAHAIVAGNEQLDKDPRKQITTEGFDENIGNIPAHEDVAVLVERFEEIQAAIGDLLYLHTTSKEEVKSKVYGLLKEIRNYKLPKRPTEHFVIKDEATGWESESYADELFSNDYADRYGETRESMKLAELNTSLNSILHALSTNNFVSLDGVIREGDRHIDPRNAAGYYN